MEEKKTVQYKRTLRGSVGSGVNSLFNGSGRRYYILEHRDASKFHKAGESQKIIIDQIELGRGNECQVRFDQTFETVSRRHAAIVREGDKWKLVQLSSTNSTLLNGRAVDTEWYLQNGDEIQLSVGGPRLGFIIPEGNQSLVSSIRMTERLNLFRKQALRPYKRAIAAIAALVLLAVAGLVTWNATQERHLGDIDDKQETFDQQIAQATDSLNALVGRNAVLDSLVQETIRQQAIEDSLINALKHQRAQVRIIDRTTDVGRLLAAVESDVFFMEAQVVITNGENTKEVPGLSWMGTGFLTTDGKFVTAKHCVEGWKYKIPTAEALGYICIGNRPGWHIKAIITATSKNRVLHLTSDDFKMNHSGEQRKVVEGTDDYVIQASGGYTDWAYANTSERGSIVIDKQLATQLPIGSDLHLLGFPLGMGAIDTHSLTPLYGSCKTSQAGLSDGIIRINARNYESGNSGGPVFYVQNRQLRAVGIVSYSVSTTTHGGITSISNLQ